MRFRRLRLTLPARLRRSAASDARTIAEAVAVALAEGGRPVGPVTVQGAGRPAHALATEVAARIAPRSRSHGR